MLLTSVIWKIHSTQLNFRHWWQSVKELNIVYMKYIHFCNNTFKITRQLWNNWHFEEDILRWKTKRRLEHIFSVSQHKGLGRDRGVVHFVYEVNGPAWGANLLFDIIFAENCTKLKKFATALQTFIHEEKFLTRYINLSLHKAAHQNSVENTFTGYNTPHTISQTLMDHRRHLSQTINNGKNSEQWKFFYLIGESISISMKKSRTSDATIRLICRMTSNWFHQIFKIG